MISIQSLLNETTPISKVQADKHNGGTPLDNEEDVIDIKRENEQESQQPKHKKQQINQSNDTDRPSNECSSVYPMYQDSKRLCHDIDTSQKKMSMKKVAERAELQFGPKSTKYHSNRVICNRIKKWIIAEFNVVYDHYKSIFKTNSQEFKEEVEQLCYDFDQLESSLIDRYIWIGVPFNEYRRKKRQRKDLNTTSTKKRKSDKPAVYNSVEEARKERDRLFIKVMNKRVNVSRIKLLIDMAEIYRSHGMQEDSQKTLKAARRVLMKNKH